MQIDSQHRSHRFPEILQYFNSPYAVPELEVPLSEIEMGQMAWVIEDDQNLLLTPATEPVRWSVTSQVKYRQNEVMVDDVETRLDFHGQPYRNTVEKSVSEVTCRVYRGLLNGNPVVRVLASTVMATTAPQITSTHEELPWVGFNPEDYNTMMDCRAHVTKPFNGAPVIHTGGNSEALTRNMFDDLYSEFSEPVIYEAISEDIGAQRHLIKQHLMQDNTIDWFVNI